MKIHFPFKFIGISCFLFSCGSEIKTFNITVYSKEPLAGNFSESNVNQLNQIKEIIPKFEINGIQFVCKSADFVRLDLDSVEKIKPRHTIANDIKIQMGVELSAEDILNDYQDSTNFQFPNFLNNPKGTSNKEFPKDCIFISNLDSLGIIIQQQVDASTEEATIKIALTPIQSDESTIFEPTEEDITIRKKPTSNTDNIKESIPPIITSDLPKLKINLHLSDDQRELLWYNNNKKNEGTVTYELIILKNNQKIISKKNITSSKISCAELNSSGLLNTDCSYKIEVRARRDADNTTLTEVYDIELVSSDKFFPRCTLNLINE